LITVATLWERGDGSREIKGTLHKPHQAHTGGVLVNGLANVLGVIAEAQVLLQGVANVLEAGQVGGFLVQLSASGAGLGGLREDVRDVGICVACRYKHNHVATFHNAAQCFTKCISALPTPARSTFLSSADGENDNPGK
jgi:hypothetical protein